MDLPSAPCPAWLITRLKAFGGSVSFHQYMDWVLNDPDQGAYATGKLRIGVDGDFVTSPSLGGDFAQLLAVQLADWFDQLEQRNHSDQRLTLVEAGPGEGQLAIDLITALESLCPDLLPKLDLVLVEPNQGMAERQRERLALLKPSVSIHWRSFADLAAAPVVGVLLAHEVLDALPVERLVWRHNALHRQGVGFEMVNSEPYLRFIELPIPEELKLSIEKANRSLGITIPPPNVPDGWCSEWHQDLEPWLKQAASALQMGPMLVIDYALEARRYFNAARVDGTLMAYRQQMASSALLESPGCCDLTAHLCLETLQYQAEQQGWNCLGEVRQGQALLALGLAEQLYGLQKLPPTQLSDAFQRREALLRLVDPAGLGEFRWLAFEIKPISSNHAEQPKLHCKFLDEPVR